MNDYTGSILHRLKDQERKVLALTVVGQSAKESGKYLKVSYRTIEKYRELLKCKFGVKDKSELISLVLRHNEGVEILNLAKKIMNESCESNS